MSRDDCINPPRVIPRSEPDPELTALYIELRRRGYNDVSLSRDLRDDGPLGSSHIHVSINSHDGNRRRMYNLGTDTADRALCCIDEWERKLAAAVEPPLNLYVACCRRCGDPILARQPGLDRSDLHGIKCPSCPGDTRTDIFSYALVDSETR